jgi:hypothetical protein
MITIGDLIPQVKDYVRNQNLDTARAIRALDTGTDYVNSELGLPSQERVCTFDFDQSQPTYSLPVDFIEPIFLRFTDEQLNRSKRFSYRPVELLYNRIKAVVHGDRRSQGTQLFGVSAETGGWVLYVLGSNSTSLLTLDTFDKNNSLNWVASGDAHNVGDDLYIYKDGAGAISFDITVSGTSATLTKTNANDNLFTYINVGHFRVWSYLESVTNLTSISFAWGTSASNYYLQSVTTQSDGTAFVVGWNQLDFTWDGCSQIGTPNPNIISRYQFVFTYGVSYTGGTSFRLDYLRLMVPDQMKLSYYSGYKGTSSTGTELTKFTASTDILNIGAFDAGLTNLYSIKAAELINPQILNDDTQAMDQYNKYSLAYKRKYPRKRINNLLAIPSTPLTD